MALRMDRAWDLRACRLACPVEHPVHVACLLALMKHPDARARSHEEIMVHHYGLKFGANCVGANVGVFTRDNLCQNFVNNYTQMLRQIVVGYHYLGQN